MTFLGYLLETISMNRSFSKIRHIQEANQRLEKRLMVEQNEQFLDTQAKNLETSGTTSPFEQCFTEQGIPQNKIPQSCKSNQTAGPCISEMLKSEFYKTPEWMDRVDKALDCFMIKVRQKK